MIKIKEPIWKPPMSIGIAERKLTNPTKIQILYRNRNKEREFPNTYMIWRDKAMEYPVQIRRGNRLRIVPIEDLEVV
jgi:hypothetical protein